MTFDGVPVDGTALLIERMVDRGFPASAIINAIGRYGNPEHIKALVERRKQGGASYRASLRGARIVEAYREVPVLAPWRVILNEVATKHKVKAKDILSKRRTHEVVNARHEAIYRIACETTLSSPEIALRLGDLDHTTVLHALNRYCALTGLPHPRRAQACQ